MKKPITAQYSKELFVKEASSLLKLVRSSHSLADARAKLFAKTSAQQSEANIESAGADSERLYLVRDCARALRSMLYERSEQRAGFSVIQALWDIAHDISRPDLTPGFFAEMIHVFRGLEGRVARSGLWLDAPPSKLTGRPAAIQRSQQLDSIWERIEKKMMTYEDGLSEASRARRKRRRQQVIGALDSRESDFDDWRWQIEHIARNGETLARLISLSESERQTINRAVKGRLPFGVTPYYATLFDESPESGRDRAIRAQVLPPPEYVEHMLGQRGERECAFDFMLERDTSPIDLITRRYPAIAILKPFNTCPQICVYCQRNWEIEEAMADGALAGEEKIADAIRFIEQHTALREILVTGGDPLALPDDKLLSILDRVAAIPHVEVIRIGSRTPVTLPMRITSELAAALGRLRDPGTRELCLVTHIEHPYEITPELVTAVDRLKRQGITVFNQLVYSFFVSRRFEAARLRMLLRRVGIDPYYTFVPKGKQETNAYRVPLARLMQERKEEVRLLPGSRRTDETVYNVPGLGKNYLRAFQHRDILSILPDGARVYDFHPWEKGVMPRESYVGTDVPILDYLKRLEAIGENADDYESIWYYY